MKKIITLFVFLISLSLFAQDKIYQHKILPSNILSGFPYASFIDHPDLNGNPNAKIVVKATQLGTQVVNNHPIDLFYNGAKWIIENADGADLVINSGFNVFIGGNSTILVKHSTNPANTNGIITQIDDPNFNNNNPGPFAIITSTTTDANRINVPYAFDYGEAQGFRWIYTENGTTFPFDVDFNIVIPGSSTSFTHISNNANMEVNQTRLDHPLLNGNPDATFVFEHYYGIGGASTNVDFPHFLSSRYDNARGQWTIYTTDGSFFVENVAFDVVIAPREVLGTEDNQFNTEVTLYPNPAKDFVTIKANSVINKISVFSILGQEVLTADNIATDFKLNVSNWETGTYFAKVQTEKGLQTIKLIKN
ncbi:MAG: T9SS type A sorting domain-containing protein [Aequorivita sp.]|nr:T9SS type A sorting domain-containing protein [Aequorivita sp.]